MAAKLMKLELIYDFVGKPLMIRTLFFAMVVVVSLMPFLYIVRDPGPCDLWDDSNPFFRPRGLGFQSQISSGRTQKEELYTAIFRDLITKGFLHSGFKGLCLGTDAGHAVLALRENGLAGIDRRSCEGRLPFVENAFDFVFSGSLDRTRAPTLLAVEIQRTLKPGGIAIIIVSPRRAGKHRNPIRFLSPIVALFRNSDVVHVAQGGNSSVVVLRKRDSLSKSLKRCSSQKQNRSLIEHVEPLTQSHINASYLPHAVDISARKRHVYVEIASDETRNSISGWFLGAYPKQNRDFMMYVVGVDESAPACCSNLRGVEAVLLKQGSDQGLKIGRWIRETVGEEDFVVVKVGFEYVRGMIQSGAICLIDELFVLCNHENGVSCMMLLHTLRNNGVFAHKW